MISDVVKKATLLLKELHNTHAKALANTLAGSINPIAVAVFLLWVKLVIQALKIPLVATDKGKYPYRGVNDFHWSEGREVRR